MILKSSKQQESAKQFLAFIKGAQGQEIMKRYGFTLPNCRRGDRWPVVSVAVEAVCYAETRRRSRDYLFEEDGAAMGSRREALKSWRKSVRARHTVKERSNTGKSIGTDSRGK